MGFRNLLVKAGLALGKVAAKVGAKYDPTGVAAALLDQMDKAHLRAELDELMAARFEQFRGEVKAAMGDLGPQVPAADRAQVEAFLSQIQAAAKQAARALGDPSATTVPATVAIDQADQLATFLPQRLPRFVVGDPVPGRPEWKLVEPLGAGGFGEAWLAENPYVADPAVFKFFTDPTARQRFTEAEALNLKKVHTDARTDGVVKLLDAAPKQDPPWLQLEYVAGGDLSALPEAWQKLPDAERVKRSLGVIRSLAKTAGQFHALGVVHRDLKPSNILLRKTEKGLKLVVADFGISKILPAEQGLIPTPTNAATATIQAYTALYASPQQKKRRPADKRDDIFALGVLWYQLLRGDLTLERPGGEGWKRALAKLGVTPAAIHLLGRCWDDEADARPADGNALAGLLDELDLPEAVEVAAPPRPVRPEPAPRPEPRRRPKPTTPPAQRGSVLKWAFLVLFFGLLVGAAVMVMSSSDEARRDLDRTSPSAGKGSETNNGPAPMPVTFRPGEERKYEIAPGVKMVFCWVPPGECQLGSPKAERDAAIAAGSKAEWVADEAEEKRGRFSTRGFWLGKYEVTQQEWTAVMGSNPSWFREGGGGAAEVKGLDTTRFPVENVSWDMICGAGGFLEKLNARDGVEPVFGYRAKFALPHEDQWEYACRGGLGNQRAFYWGNEINGTQANIDGNYPFGTATKGPYLQRPTPVGLYAAKFPHPWGLCDLHGNVWEWCDNKHEQMDIRVLRGGSWLSYGGHDCRAAYRGRGTADFVDLYCGVRVLLPGLH